MSTRAILSGLCLAVLLSAATTPTDTRLADAAMQGDKDAVHSLLKQRVDVNASHGDGATALHWAAYNDDLDMLKMVLAAGANVKAATRDGAITPLFMACTNGNAAMIEALLKAGSDAKSVKSNGTTALMIAAASGHADAVKVLLDHGAEVNAKETTFGQTALMFAAALNRDAVVKLLRERGADPNIATPVRKMERVRFDQDGNIVEDRPAGRGNGGASASNAEEQNPQAELDALAHALGFKSAIYSLGKPRPRAGDVAARGPRKVGADFMGGMTALLYAAREGHFNAARALVESGANINQVNGDKFTPMVLAIINGHLDLAKYLLDHGADPNLASESGIAALYAVIDVQWAPKSWFPQPTTEQEKVVYLDLMKALIEKGANVNAAVGEKPWFRSFTNDYTWVDPAGATSFWRAAQSSDIVAMRLLIAHGADPKVATKSAETPLMAAAGIGWAANWSVNAPYPALDAVKYCVELGNDVNAVDSRGYTALHGAAYLGNNDMVNYLVSKGANVKAKSKGGDYVADMANGPTRFGQPHLETVALLEKLGSPNSHNCRSDQCVIAAGASIYQRPLSPGEEIVKENLDKFAVSLGFKSVEYLADVPPMRGIARGAQAQETPVPASPQDSPKPAAAKPPGGGR
ncbi:MAG TPA: ankyrin repeat domain-containing protein [Bryobacteraceae bacterium]|nr:ankyrin repeat domain-containing protein [Bryobacteraceae bacterium]